MPVALVTGGAKRLGRCMALALTGMGYDIILHYQHSHEDALKTAAQIAQQGRQCHLVAADLRDEQQRQSLWQQAVKWGGEISLLINNAAVFMNDTSHTMTAESWRMHQEVNLLAPLYLMRQMAEQAQNTSKQKNMINMLDSTLTSTPEDLFFSYYHSKASLTLATKMLARSYAPHVRVNGIALGTTLIAPTQSTSHFEAQQQATPLGYGATPDDVVSALKYLISTPAVTGQIMYVDGGMSA